MSTTHVPAFTPEECNLPEKFTAFRPAQEQALDFLINSSARFKALAMPTGSGKSPLYMAYAGLTGSRAVILTATKGLQDQLNADFAAMGLIDIRGRENYQCRLGSNFNCQSGSLVKCYHQKTNACPYVQQWTAANGSQLVVTNYSYWCASMLHGRGLGKVDLLILDEGHEADEEVTRAAGIEIYNRECLSMLGADWPYDPQEPKAWIAWANQHLPTAQYETERYDTLLRELGTRAEPKTVDIANQWKQLLGKIQSLQQLNAEYIIHHTNRSSWKLDPLWPRDHSERVLFHGIPEVVIVSATLSEKSLDLLLGSKAERDYLSLPSPFNPRRSPIYHIPTVQLSRHVKAEGLAKWLDNIDRILDSRNDRKGIIHTVSYDRAMYLLEHSRHNARMISNASSRNTADTLQRYILGPADSVLVSPSVTTGFDFAYDLCEYQIIGKLPFPDGRHPLTKARSKADGFYTPYLTAITITQMHGRGMRHADDQCETFIVDDQITWFRSKYRLFFPAYLRNRITTQARIPPKPPKLIPPEWFRTRHQHINQITDQDLDPYLEPPAF